MPRTPQTPLPSAMPAPPTPIPSVTPDLTPSSTPAPDTAQRHLSPPSALQRLRQGWREALHAIFTDKGVALLLIIAPLIYGFFYPWPYAHEVVQRVPTAIVDKDHSSLSRQIVRFAQASPRMQVMQFASEAEAQQALWAGQIEGYAVLPAHLRRDVLLSRPVQVPIYGNGGYVLLNKSVLYGFAETVGTVSAGIEIRQLTARGMPAAAANVLRSPVTIDMVAAFNPTEGYGSSVVPAVAMLILQQTLLMAAGMMIGTWAEGGLPASDGTVPAPVPAHTHDAWRWLGRVLALALPNVLVGMFYFGWIYIWQGYGHGGNMVGVLILLPAFALCCACWGCVIGLWTGNRERVMQVLLFAAMPLFFISGYAWPASALPWPLDTLRWLAPSTAGIHASVLLNQMGAGLHAVLPDLFALVALGLAAFAALVLHGRRALAPSAALSSPCQPPCDAPSSAA